MTASPFHAISDPTRRGILDLLMQGPRCAGDLAQAFPGMTRPAVSKHLRVLRSSRLVRPERRGRELWYQLNPQPLTQVEGWLLKYREFWGNRLEALKKAAEK